MGTSYQLNLLTAIKIYNVFHFNLLRPIIINLLPDQHNSLSLLIVTNKRKKKKWEVNDIINAKKN